MKTTAVIAVFMAITAMFACSSSETTRQEEGTLKGHITISGAFALYPMMMVWAEEFQKIHPEVQIDVSAGGAGKGMTDVLSGMVDIAMVSREIKQEEIEKGAWFISVTRDAVVPVCNAENPSLKAIQANGISSENFLKAWQETGTIQWKDLVKGGTSDKANVFTRSDACGAAEMWAKYLGLKQEDLLGTGVFGDPGIAEAVKGDKFGLGYNNINYAYDLQTGKPYPGLAIIPLDLNNDGVLGPEELFYQDLNSIVEAIRTGKYPSPPARDLYLVLKGKATDPVFIEFMKWILNDGQKFVSESGYVLLPDEQMKQERAKLE